MKRMRLEVFGILTAVAALLSTPAALAQVPQQPCGTPPQPIQGSISFQDITTSLGYQTLANPTSDTLSDFIGGCDAYCEQNGQCCTESQGPWATPSEVGTISLPFPFGFSGVYADGGSFNQPFKVNVWANGLLTFDSSVSFDPFAYPLQNVPPNCTGNAFVETCQGNICTSQDISVNPMNGAVADVFGALPFIRPTNPPNALIAPWWGDLSVCPGNGQVGWLLSLDDNQQPMAIIQWTNVTASAFVNPNIGFNCFSAVDFSSCTDPGANLLSSKALAALPNFTFQVRLHANNDVDFVYGPSSSTGGTDNCFASAVGNCNYLSGIQSNLFFPGAARPPLLDYAVGASSCGAQGTCTQSQFPSNTSVTFRDVFRSVGPDIQVTGMNPPDLVPQGGTVTVPLTMSNGGGTASTGQGQVQFYFSAGSNQPQGTPFSLQNVAVVPACAIQTFNAQVAIPAQVPQGGGYLVAEFIPGAESVDQTHSFSSAAVVVGPPEPDLAAVGALSFDPANIVGGQIMSVSFTVANVGEIDAPATAYGIYVSLGGTISSGDIQIAGGLTPALAAGSAPQVVTLNNIRVPETLVSGDYLIGVMLNPGGTLKEINQTNNVAIGNKLLAVTSPGPVIATTSLRDAQANSPYSVQLVAGGGDGKYTWSLAAGALPAGLTLSKAGLVSGQAEQQGSSSFTARVTDGVGHSATAVLSINVNPFNQSLVVETQTLPAGSTGQLYNFTIAAVGGTAPYTWALVPGQGSLPSGITLTTSGQLVGQPTFDGSSTFEVTVTDSAGASATSPLYTITIFAAGTLAVGSTTLPTATIGDTYNTTLHASGGTGPYQWSILDVFREPSSPGDTGTDLGTSLGSLGLNLYGPEIEGVPTEVGVFALGVEVTDAESPVAHAEGLVLLTITAQAGFSFTTVQLPAATTNQYYQTTLATNAPATDAVTCVVVNDELKPTDTAKLCLPPGISLYGSTCQFSGVPLEAGTFSCIVEANDSQGGVATQSFTIEVDPAPAPAGGGCQTAAGVPGAAGLVLLALTHVRRRRRAR